MADAPFLCLSATAWTAIGSIGTVAAAFMAVRSVSMTRRQILESRVPDLVAMGSESDYSFNFKTMLLSPSFTKSSIVSGAYFPVVDFIITNLGLGVAKNISFEWIIDWNSVIKRANFILHEMGSDYFMKKDGDKVSFGLINSRCVIHIEPFDIKIPYIKKDGEFNLKTRPNMMHFYAILAGLEQCYHSFKYRHIPYEASVLPSLFLKLNYFDVYGRELHTEFEIRVSVYEMLPANQEICFPQIVLNSYQVAKRFEFKIPFSASYARLKSYWESLIRCSCMDDDWTHKL